MSQLRILHVAGSLSRQGIGVSTVVWGLARAQERAGCRVSLVCIDDPYLNEDVPDGFRASVHAFRESPPRFWLYSRELGKRIADLVDDVDVVHSHGLWLYPGVAAGRAARRRGRPYVVAPQGMLEPWALRRSRLKKCLAWHAFEHGNLAGAACLQATASEEYGHIRGLGQQNPVAIVPNAVEPSEFLPLPSAEAVDRRWGQWHDNRVMLFLSRLHPKKGLMNLVTAFGRVLDVAEDWRLVIAGPDQLGHRAQVEKQVRALGLEERTTFVGPVFGEEKRLLMARADLFVLPTYSENFGIAVAESLLCGVPVITTKGTPWRDLAEHRCGWWVNIGTEPLAEALDEAFRLSDRQLAAMGVRGQQLVFQKYTWTRVAAQMINVYEWVLGGRQPRRSVTFD